MSDEPAAAPQWPCPHGIPFGHAYPNCRACMVADGVIPGGDKLQRIAFLERKLTATRADLLLKFEDEDDHGVADAAMDCRDIRNELKGLRF